MLRGSTTRRPLTGHEGGELLDAPRVQEQNTVLARSVRLAPLHREVFGAAGSGAFLVEDADGAVLPDAVRDLGRIYPHREFRREQAVQVRGRQTDRDPRLGDHGVHLAVDA